MSKKIEIGVLEISIKNGEIEIFDGNQWVGIGIELDEWQSVKDAVEKLIADNKKAQEKRQPIKEPTLHEFNNARQVAYGNNVQVEPLANNEADLSHEAWLDFKVKNKPQAERTVKWLIREYDIKLD